MGIAPGTKESRGTVAYAFYDRIQDVTLTIGADVAVILGHVIRTKSAICCCPTVLTAKMA